MSNVVEAEILTGPFKGDDFLIPHFPAVKTDEPFQFMRQQFPIALACAITINKSQSHFFKLCGSDLNPDCFSHGLLRAGCSGVGKPDNICTCTDNGTTTNSAYAQVCLI